MKLSCHKWVLLFISIFMLFLTAVISLTVIVDPFFHYHKPLNRLEYPLSLSKTRYLNLGIIKNFEYDAIITGSSLTDSFRVSEFDDLFGTHAIKVPFGGGTYKEVNDNLTVAAECNPDLKIIFRCLDYHQLLSEADAMSYADDFYPRYLYDDCLWNDVKYVLNKSILFEDVLPVFRYTAQGNKTTDFDTYCNWAKDAVFSKETTDGNYTFPEKGTGDFYEITEAHYSTITKNIFQNATKLVEENPEIDFYFYFPPCNIYFWNNHYQAGTILVQLDAEKYVIEMLLQYKNVHLFSFFTEYDLICNLDEYIDTMHYSENVHSQILKWIADGTHELTLDNYESYCLEERNFYLNFDYDSLYPA